MHRAVYQQQHVNIPPPTYLAPHQQQQQQVPWYQTHGYQPPSLLMHPTSYFGSPHAFTNTSMFSGFPPMQQQPVVQPWHGAHGPSIPAPSYQQHNPFAMQPQTVQPSMFTHSPSSLFSAPSSADTAMDVEPPTVDPFQAFSKTYSDDDIVKHYHPPDAGTMKKQNDLAEAIHQHLYKNGSQMADPKQPESLPDDLAGRLREVIADHAPLNLGGNPLGKIWDVSASGYGGAKKGSEKYAAVRGMDPVRSHIAKVTASHPEKTGELHHGLKKAAYPYYATEKKNLFLLTRKHGDTMGQHDQLHSVMASGTGNKWQKSLPANDVEMSSLLGLGAFTPKSAPNSKGKTYSKLIDHHV